MVGTMPGPWMLDFESKRRQAEHHGHPLGGFMVSDGRNGAYGSCESCGLSLHLGYQLGDGSAMKWLDRFAALGNGR